MRSAGGLCLDARGQLKHSADPAVAREESMEREMEGDGKGRDEGEEGICLPNWWIEAPLHSRDFLSGILQKMS